MRLFCCWAIIFISFVSYTTKAEGCTSNSYKKLVTALSEKHEYYSINEDINLDGNTIKFPEGSVIEFNGGTISNGTIICQNNTLTGFSGIANDVAIGGIVIGPLNISVFDLKRDNRQFDIGNVLNKANKVCKSIIVPEGVFYIQTPVVFSDIKYYRQFGDLIYNGKAKDITVLQFFKAFTAVIDINGKIAYDIESKVINYTRTKRTNIIGVEFANINNCRVYIGDVEYFNNNIRISAYGAGNCYNQYTINLSVFSNEHLRIYQEDIQPKQFGWCNENVFIGGRFSNWSYFDWNNCESVAIKIEGNKNRDTYNGANSLLFIKPCMEGFKNYAVYAKNVIGCHWQDARTEGCGFFIRFAGDCISNEANVTYGTDVIDYDESTTFPILVENLIPVYSVAGGGEKVLEIETNAARLFKVNFNGPNAKARVGVQYIDDKNGNTISRVIEKTMKRPRSTAGPDSFYYNDGLAQWKLAADSSECTFVIPDNVIKVRLFLSGEFTGATIYSDKQIKVY